jgi:hypothetical protein
MRSRASQHGLAVSAAVYDLVVQPMLLKLGLHAIEHGEILPSGGHPLR